MHEYSILQSMLERVEHEMSLRAATSVSSIQLSVGELSGVEVSLLERAWSLFEDHPQWGKTKLSIDRVAACWRCPSCEQELERGAILRCSRCQVPARLVAGDEILLDRIEMEVPEREMPEEIPGLELAESEVT